MPQYKNCLEPSLGIRPLGERGVNVHIVQAAEIHYTKTIILLAALFATSQGQSGQPADLAATTKPSSWATSVGSRIRIWDIATSVEDKDCAKKSF